MPKPSIARAMVGIIADKEETNVKNEETRHREKEALMVGFLDLQKRALGARRSIPVQEPWM
jgi:hypothetical protein